MLCPRCPGVAEVATVGGYQSSIGGGQSDKLSAYGLSINDVTRALRQSNADVGGPRCGTDRAGILCAWSGIHSEPRCHPQSKPRSRTGRHADPPGSVATVSFGPDIRRGVGDLDGIGEAVGGTIVMRMARTHSMSSTALKQKSKS